MFGQIFRRITRHIDLRPSKPPVLGRWALVSDNVAHYRADMTNEDHCGVCDKMRYNYIDKNSKK
tara:strand:+ start:1390 stop:1581 length:192 start_codon:yes stop_codon:yes gene_type:complete